MAKTQYVVRGYFATSAQDNYQNGQVIGKQYDEFMPATGWTQKADTLAALIAILCDEFHVERDCILLDSCDEPGRIDVECLQRERFVIAKPSAATMAKFKTGTIDMWETTYTVHVERVTSEFSLTGQIKAEWN